MEFKFAEACVNDADVSDAGEVSVARCWVRVVRAEAVRVALIRVVDRRERDCWRWEI